MKSPVRVAASVAVMFLVLAAVLFSVLQFPTNSKTARAAESNAPLPEVAVVELTACRLPLTTQLSGRTVPYLIAEIRPQVSGLVQKRVFTEGSDVKAGDVLYQIDPASYQAAYDNSLANLDVARKTADRARAALAVSLAAVTQKSATLDLAKINRDRALRLFKESIIPASQRDAAVTEAAVADASLQASKAQVDSDRQSVAGAEASIKQAEAMAETERINLGYTKITAPISGRIGKSSVTIGAIVTGYQQAALATIQQLDPIYVDVPQSTSELLRLKRRLEGGHLSVQEGAQKVGLLLEDGTAYPLAGTLQFRDISVDVTTGSVIIRAIFPNPKGILLPGAFVRAVVNEGVNENALLIPQQAISRDTKGKPSTLVVTAENKVEQRRLTLERAVGDKWLVIEGVQPGDRVIVEGMQKVKPGAVVRAVPAAATVTVPENTTAKQGVNAH